MNYNFEEGIFNDFKEESVIFLVLDFQSQVLKEEGLKLLFRVENFDSRDTYKTEEKIRDRLIEEIEEIECKYKDIDVNDVNI